jgi:hypothetical protein
MQILSSTFGDRKNIHSFTLVTKVNEKHRSSGNQQIILLSMLGQEIRPYCYALQQIKNHISFQVEKPVTYNQIIKRKSFKQREKLFLLI